MTRRLHRHRAACALLGAALLLLTTLLPRFTPDASAHAALLRATPTFNETLSRPPTRVVLRFSEAVEPRLTRIQVFDQKGGRVDEGDMAFDESDGAIASVGVERLDPGLYRVKWSNVSKVDGHNVKGQYAFVVLNADETLPAGVSLEEEGGERSEGGLLPGPWDSFLKWAGLLALSTMAGAAFFVPVVLRPSAAFLHGEEEQRVADAGDAWLANLAHVLMPVAFIASSLLVVLAVTRFATDTGLVSYLTDVRAGQYRGAQLLLIIVALVGAEMIYLAASRRVRNIGLAIVLLALAGALLAYSMPSHAATEKGKFWSVASDYAHLLAASAWLGALVLLPLFVRWVRRELEPPHRFLLMANVFDRFSVVALLSVIAVLATGAFNGIVEVPNASAMVDTTYGRVLVAKLALVTPLLAVAGLNAAVLKPRLVAAIDRAYAQDGMPPDDVQARGEQSLASLQRLLPRTILVEAVLVAAVFAAVGVLSQTATARGEVSQEQAQAQQVDFKQIVDVADVRLTLEVRPNRVGLNEYTIDVRNRDGSPAETVSQVRLRFRFENNPDLEPSSTLLMRSAAGDWRNTGSDFSQAGNWRIDVTVRRTDADDVAQAFVLPVRQTTVGAAGTTGAFELPFDSFTWNEVAGVALAILGGVVVIFRRQLAAAARLGARAGLGIAGALFVGGAALAFSGDSHTTSDPRAGNPVPATKESVERGRMLFQQNCTSCHGVDGIGNGPAAANLNPRPTDFRQHIPLHTDPQFYNFIANGYPDSQMPKFTDAFSVEDIWNLVNFLRTEFSEKTLE